MYNSRITIGSRARQGSAFKVSLGNSGPRYNSEVAVQRRKYLMSSTKNSEQVPEWMSRTQSYHFRQHNRNRSLFTNPTTAFKQVKQTYVYAGLNRPSNPEGQFDRLPRNRQRTRWEMKNHTFELDWPKPELPARVQEVKVRSQMSMYETAGAKAGGTGGFGRAAGMTTRWQMPKYGYFESPLHVQKETPVKIGHPYLLNSTYVK